jgi:ligand-binding sensor domain-containing protein/signal transduction histidine kinase/DNA-binding response OmpR family regulator
VGQTNFEFKKLSKKDGLSQASVFAITQDKSGFMWFGTREGLNKYDGYQFKIYQTNSDSNSLVANDIRDLYYDETHHGLWIGTTGGLSKYQSATDNFVNFSHSPKDSNSISNNVIRDVTRDSKGRLWVGTSIGINLLDEKTGKFTRYYCDKNTTQSNKSNDVSAILEDKVGNVWVGTGSGLYILNIDNNESIEFKPIDPSPDAGFRDYHIKNIIEDSEGNFWIGTFENGIKYWNKKTGSVTSYQNEESDPSSISHNNIRSLCLDKDENLWIGTFDGLNLLENGSKVFKRFTKSNNGNSGLSDKSIRALYIDQRQSLWVGTYYGGINHLDEIFNRFKNENHSRIGNRLKGNVVSAFAEDKNNNLWIGTEGEGLNYYDKVSKQILNFKHNASDINSISGNNVKELLLDKDKLWIGTFQAGLNMYDTKSKEFKVYKTDLGKSNTLSSNNVYGLLKEDNLLWVLTYGGGLDILDIERDSFHNYSNIIEDKRSLSSDLTRVILKTDEGQLWIGTDNGLNKVTKNAKQYPSSFERYLSTESIYSLTEDNNGQLWIGTVSNGFYKMDPQSNVLNQYTTQEGLPGNTVFGIIQISNEELWISTNNGLSKFNPQEQTFKNYDYSNGLENTEYNFNAYFKDSEGDILFGGLNGLTYFDPEEIKSNEYIPPIVFTDFRKNNRVINAGDQSGILENNINETQAVTLNYNDANFSISFAALDYFSPESNRYAYMLDGIDNGWKYSVGETDATYTIQNSGEYTFRLKGGNSDGLWNQEERSLKIKVLPPIWKTGWAYLLYALVLAALIIGTYRFIKLRHNLQLEKIINQQQAELNETKLRFFTNITHEFRTPLTLIIAPLRDLLSKENLSNPVTNQLQTVERNANRMLNLVNQILTFRKLATDHSELNITKGNIVIFTKEIFLLFQDSADRNNINYVFESEKEAIDIWFDEDKLEKVLFNLLSNAFKFTPNEENIRIQITENHSSIEISISDSGIGIAREHRNQIFKRFYEKSNSEGSAIKGSGIGLAISKELVELHRGTILLADEGNSHFQNGTTFVIQLRKGKEHFSTKDIINQSSINQPLRDYPILTENEPIEESMITPNLEPSANAYTLLIVEDNTEVRQYITSLFASEYLLHTAVDGLEGLEKVKSEHPDLVISDVMMPQKDGISLCKEIKSNFEISHIPVILLTARAASLFKIEGLETGADDYVTKPFDPDELRLRVRNIINSRQEIRDKFKRILTLDPKEIQVTSAEEIFLEKALQIIETQISNPNYKVDQFAHDLAVSRPLLFTKLKALTGLTPNNFIKSIRLKRAEQLLKSQKTSISETAYQVGFKDVKYFSKVFKERYSMTPSEFKQAHSA